MLPVDPSDAVGLLLQRFDERSVDPPKVQPGPKLGIRTGRLGIQNDGAPSEIFVGETEYLAEQAAVHLVGNAVAVLPT